ncbi:hypothetical protein FACS1894152_1350 [Bacilli bacterium]|nr:hypothetical protein FACS1894152_1350 [Bacilli bacterium]
MSKDNISGVSGKDNAGGNTNAAGKGEKKSVFERFASTVSGAASTIKKKVLGSEKNTKNDVKPVRASVKHDIPPTAQFTGTSGSVVTAPKPSTAYFQDGEFDDSVVPKPAPTVAQTPAKPAPMVGNPLNLATGMGEGTSSAYDNNSGNTYVQYKSSESTIPPTIPASVSDDGDSADNVEEEEKKVSKYDIATEAEVKEEDYASDEFDEEIEDGEKGNNARKSKKKMEIRTEEQENLKGKENVVETETEFEADYDTDDFVDEDEDKRKAEEMDKKIEGRRKKQEEQKQEEQKKKEQKTGKRQNNRIDGNIKFQTGKGKTDIKLQQNKQQQQSANPTPPSSTSGAEEEGWKQIVNGRIVDVVENEKEGKHKKRNRHEKAETKPNEGEYKDTKNPYYDLAEEDGEEMGKTKNITSPVIQTKATVTAPLKRNTPKLSIFNDEDNDFDGQGKQPNPKKREETKLTEKQKENIATKVGGKVGLLDTIPDDINEVNGESEPLLTKAKHAGYGSNDTTLPLSFIKNSNGNSNPTFDEFFGKENKGEEKKKEILKKRRELAAKLAEEQKEYWNGKGGSSIQRNEINRELEDLPKEMGENVKDRARKWEEQLKNPASSPSLVTSIIPPAPPLPITDIGGNIPPPPPLSVGDIGDIPPPPPALNIGEEAIGEATRKVVELRKAEYFLYSQNGDKYRITATEIAKVSEMGEEGKKEHKKMIEKMKDDKKNKMMNRFGAGNAGPGSMNNELQARLKRMRGAIEPDEEQDDTSYDKVLADLVDNKRGLDNLDENEEAIMINAIMAANNNTSRENIKNMLNKGMGNAPVNRPSVATATVATSAVKQQLPQETDRANKQNMMSELGRKLKKRAEVTEKAGEKVIFEPQAKTEVNSAMVGGLSKAFSNMKGLQQKLAESNDEDEVDDWDDDDEKKDKQQLSSTPTVAKPLVTLTATKSLVPSPTVASTPTPQSQVPKVMPELTYYEVRYYTSTSGNDTAIYRIPSSCKSIEWHSSGDKASLGDSPKLIPCKIGGKPIPYEIVDLNPPSDFPIYGKNNGKEDVYALNSYLKEVAAYKEKAKQKAVPSPQKTPAPANPAPAPALAAPTPEGVKQAKEATGIQPTEGIITYDDGRIYTGQLLNEKPGGQGMLTHPNGSVFMGQFEDGKMETGKFFYKKDGKAKEIEIMGGSPTGEIVPIGSVEEAVKKEKEKRERETKKKEEGKEAPAPAPAPAPSLSAPAPAPAAPTPVAPAKPKLPITKEDEGFLKDLIAMPAHRLAKPSPEVVALIAEAEKGLKAKERLSSDTPKPEIPVTPNNDSDNSTGRRSKQLGIGILQSKQPKQRRGIPTAEEDIARMAEDELDVGLLESTSVKPHTPNNDQEDTQIVLYNKSKDISTPSKSTNVSANKEFVSLLTERDIDAEEGSVPYNSLFKSATPTQSKPISTTPPATAPTTPPATAPTTTQAKPKPFVPTYGIGRAEIRDDGDLGLNDLFKEPGTPTPAEKEIKEMNRLSAQEKKMMEVKEQRKTGEAEKRLAAAQEAAAKKVKVRKQMETARKTEVAQTVAKPAPAPASVATTTPASSLKDENGDVILTIPQKTLSEEEMDELKEKQKSLEKKKEELKKRLEELDDVPDYYGDYSNAKRNETDLLKKELGELEKELQENKKEQEKLTPAPAPATTSIPTVAPNPPTAPITTPAPASSMEEPVKKGKRVEGIFYSQLGDKYKVTSEKVERISSKDDIERRENIRKYELIKPELGAPGTAIYNDILKRFENQGSIDLDEDGIGSMKESDVMRTALEVVTKDELQQEKEPLGSTALNPAPASAPTTAPAPNPASTAATATTPTTQTPTTFSFGTDTGGSGRLSSTPTSPTVSSSGGSRIFGSASASVHTTSGGTTAAIFGTEGSAHTSAYKNPYYNIAKGENIAINYKEAYEAQTKIVGVSNRNKENKTIDLKGLSDGVIFDVVNKTCEGLTINTESLTGALNETLDKMEEVGRDEKIPETEKEKVQKSLESKVSNCFAEAAILQAKEQYEKNSKSEDKSFYEALSINIEKEVLTDILEKCKIAKEQNNTGEIEEQCKKATEAERTRLFAEEMKKDNPSNKIHVANAAEGKTYKELSKEYIEVVKMNPNHVSFANFAEKSTEDGDKTWEFKKENGDELICFNFKSEQAKKIDITVMNTFIGADVGFLAGFMQYVKNCVPDFNIKDFVHGIEVDGIGNNEPEKKLAFILEKMGREENGKVVARDPLLKEDLELLKEKISEDIVNGALKILEGKYPAPELPAVPSPTSPAVTVPPPSPDKSWLSSVSSRVSMDGNLTSSTQHQQRLAAKAMSQTGTPGGFTHE